MASTYYLYIERKNYMYNDGRPSALIYLWLVVGILVLGLFGTHTLYGEVYFMVMLVFFVVVILYEIRAWGKFLLRAIEVYTENEEKK